MPNFDNRIARFLGTCFIGIVVGALVALMYRYPPFYYPPQNDKDIEESLASSTILNTDLRYESLIQQMCIDFRCKKPVMFRVSTVPFFVANIAFVASAQSAYHIIMDSRVYGIATPQEVRAFLAHEMGHVYFMNQYGNDLRGMPYGGSQIDADNVAMKYVPPLDLLIAYQKHIRYPGVDPAMRHRMDNILRAFGGSAPSPLSRP